MAVDVYSKPNCVQCTATYRLMKKEGIEYNHIDITEDVEAMRFATSFGYKGAPVVVAGDKHWSGFRPDMIKALAA